MNRFPTHPTHSTFRAPRRAAIAFGICLFLLAGTGGAQPGRLDTGFGFAGKTTMAIDLGADLRDFVGAAAVQPDGKIVLAGWAANTGFRDDLVVARLSADGMPDSSFGTNGVQVFPLDIGGNENEQAQAVTIAPDGKILVAASVEVDTNDDFDWAVIRLTPTGLLDTTFDGDGIALVSLNVDGGKTDRVEAIALQPDGKVVLAGWATATNGTTFMAAARLTANGALDSGFNTIGRVLVSFGGGPVQTSKARAVVIQPDGKIVLAGETFSTITSEDFAIARLTTNGQIDTSFDTDGKVAIDFGPALSADYATGLAIDSSGRIIVGGRRSTASATEYAIARLNPNGGLDATFDADGRNTGSFAFLGSGGSNGLVLESDGSVVLAGWVENNGFGDFGAMRFLADGSRGSFGILGGSVVPFDLGGDNQDEAKAIARAPNGDYILAGVVDRDGNGDFDFGITRLLGLEVFGDGFEGGNLNGWAASVP